MTSLLNKVINALEQIVLEVTDTTTGTVKWVEGDGEWAHDLFPKSGNNKNSPSMKKHLSYSIFSMTPHYYGKYQKMADYAQACGPKRR